VTGAKVGSRDEVSDRFGHEAMFYRGMEGFLDGVVPFIREGLDGDEAILVAVDPAKIALIEDRLGKDSDSVAFVDMSALGRNPARIIPVWRQYVAGRRPLGPIRGVGEPIWPGRSEAEMVECHLHESLLNLAFDDGPGWRLACPYDTDGLAFDVIEEARRTHPFVLEGGVRRASDRYAAARAVTEVFDSAFPEPEGPVETVETAQFDLGSLATVRRLVAEAAGRAGLDPDRAMDLVVAVNEVATNSLRYGGGRGTLRMWQEGRAFICEIRDEGCIDHPLVGREVPTPDQMGGRGLWMVNQLCDLVQLRSSPTGAAVRLHTTLA
jgi:anti-sigma regulatory factor (Ser/Thr protein kinase)